MASLIGAFALALSLQIPHGVTANACLRRLPMISGHQFHHLFSAVLSLDFSAGLTLLFFFFFLPQTGTSQESALDTVQDAGWAGSGSCLAGLWATGSK